MARVTFVKKARVKQGACRVCGTKIKVGDSYHWWANRIGRSSIRGVTCAEHKPRRSMLTTSDKLSRIYAAEEELEASIANAESVEDIKEALEVAAGEAEEVAQEYRDAIESMPENFQQGDQAMEMEEKAEQLEDWAQTLRNALDDIDSLGEEEEEGEEKEEKDNQQVLIDAKDAADQACGEMPL